MANRKQKTIIKLEDDFIDMLTNTLFKQKRVKITGLGIFSVVKAKGRIFDKHPKTGKRVVVPPHLRIAFTLSKTFKNKLKAYEKKSCKTSK